MQKNETKTPTYSINQNKLKWIKDLNMSNDTIKVIEESISRKISHILHSNIFANMSPRSMETKENK